MEGLITAEEKPSNTEVLGLLMDVTKLKFITNINPTNIKGICKLKYLTERLNHPEKDPIKINDKILEDYLALKCSVTTKKGNRADQIVDALKHIIDDDNKDNIKSIAQEIKK